MGRHDALNAWQRAEGKGRGVRNSSLFSLIRSPSSQPPNCLPAFGRLSNSSSNQRFIFTTEHSEEHQFLFGFTIPRIRQPLRGFSGVPHAAIPGFWKPPCNKRLDRGYPRYNMPHHMSRTPPFFPDHVFALAESFDSPTTRCAAQTCRAPNCTLRWGGGIKGSQNAVFD